MNEYGNLAVDQAWYDSPLQKYMHHKRTRDRLTKKRLSDIRSVIIESPAGSDYKSFDEFLNWRENDVTIEDAWKFLDQLRDTGLAENTVREKMTIVQSFMDKLYKREVVNGNAFSLVVDEANFDSESKDILERTVDEVGQFLKTIPEPQFLAAGILFAKTGIRSGEMINIDLMDLNLDYKPYKTFLEDRGIQLNQKVKDRPDSLFISSVPTIGEEYRSEIRSRGNKRKQNTIFPIDGETKRALLNWTAMRPPTEYPHPLWTGRQGLNRISNVTFSNFLTRKYAADAGFIDDALDNRFTPHWFRHMFTTQLDETLGDHPKYLSDNMISYLRGDTSGNIKEEYKHNWGNAIRRPYKENIYRFGIYN